MLWSPSELTTWGSLLAPVAQETIMRPEVKRSLSLVIVPDTFRCSKPS